MKFSSFNVTKVLTVIVVGLVLLNLYWRYPFSVEMMTTIQSNLIISSGILTGIMIAYMSAKQVQIRQDREKRQSVIENYSDKITSYRIILYWIIDDWMVWRHHEFIGNFEDYYQDIDFFEFREKLIDEELDPEIESADKIEKLTITLYLAMKELTGSTDNAKWPHDKTYSPNYTIDQLSRYYKVTYNLWTFLIDARTVNVLDLSELDSTARNEIIDYSMRIDRDIRPNFDNRIFLTKHTYKFHEVYIPHLIQLTRENSRGLPHSMNTLLGIMVFILVTGLMIPLTMQVINIPIVIGGYLTFSMVLMVFCGLTYFMFDFYKFLVKDVKLVG